MNCQKNINSVMTCDNLELLKSLRILSLRKRYAQRTKSSGK